MCNGALGAITVALAVIWIVKANENRISYGQYYRIEFPTHRTEVTSFSYVVNNVCLQPFHVRTCKCICLWPYFQSVRLSILLHRNLGSVWLTSWILLRWTNTLIPNRERGAIFDLVGSFGISIRGDPTCIPLSLEGLSKATTRKPHRICSTWRTCESARFQHNHHHLLPLIYYYYYYNCICLRLRYFCSFAVKSFPYVNDSLEPQSQSQSQSQL